ncbi:MAG: ROK family protein, partial [Methylobacteriaceae bacterium]|nr:ROK family protein [Methylobacteriaceae bacterium]
LLGIDIGGTKTALVAGTLEGRIIEKVQFPSDAGRGPQGMLGDIEGRARAMLDRHPSIVGIGASVGGPVDAERGLVLGPPNLPGWDAVPLAAFLAERLARPSRIEHDAKACALAEWRYEAGRGARDMVFLTLGTGLGAGIIANGQLVRGAGNLAGEIGHWRIAADGPDIYGKRGSFEGWCSGAGLPALARSLASDRLVDVHDAADLVARAGAGDPDAQTVIAGAGAALGRGLAFLVDLLAPERIVLGNLARRLGAGFLEAARESLAVEALPALAARCEIVCCALADAIGDMAALSVAAEACEADDGQGRSFSRREKVPPLGGG